MRLNCLWEQCSPSAGEKISSLWNPLCLMKTTVANAENRSFTKAMSSAEGSARMSAALRGGQHILAQKTGIRKPAVLLYVKAAASRLLRMEKTAENTALMPVM